MALADLFRSTRPVVRSSRHSGRASSSTGRKRSQSDRAESNPDSEELRERRVAYYSPTTEQRRRLPTRSKTVRSGPSLEATMEVQEKSAHRRASKTARNSAIPLSTPKATPKAAATKSQRRRRGEGGDPSDYVYRQSSHRNLPNAKNVGELNYHTSMWRAGVRSSKIAPPPPPPEDEKLPMISETELTPDDSISQVLERSQSRPTRTKSPIRPALGNRRLASREVTTVRQTKPSNHSTSNIPGRRTTRRSSSLSSLLVPKVSEPETPQLVDCLTCGSDDIPVSKSARLECGHRMCHACLKRVFDLSVKDPAHMPPKCCTDQHIPLKHVDKLFSTTFKLLWNRKYQEYNTKNRIYCPNPKCGEWIKPSHIHKEQGRKYALCPRCHTKACTLCCNKLHKTRDCPKDPEIAKLVEQAKDQGWQRCYNCHAMVEKREGCNHMTCRCNAEFCMLCGAKWKTCDCTWFDYTGLPNPDRLNDMRIPEPVHVMLRHVFRAVADPVQLDELLQDLPAPNERPNHRPGIPANNRQEQHNRRRQEALDADLARRLQLALMLDEDDEQPRGRGPMDMPGAFGNVLGHFRNDNFVQNAADLVMDALGGADVDPRGERSAGRSAGRRRRARQAEPRAGDAGAIYEEIDMLVLDEDRD